MEAPGRVLFKVSARNRSLHIFDRMVLVWKYVIFGVI